MGVEPVSGLVSLGAGAAMRTWEQLFTLRLGGSLTQALKILF